MFYLQNGREYEQRLNRPFAPPVVTLKEIRDAVPKHLLQSSNWKSLGYLFRDILMAASLVLFATFIDSWVLAIPASNYWIRQIMRSFLFVFYWVFQGLVWAGLFCLGHDAGHGTLFSSSLVNNAVGLFTHTALLTPYFSWRFTHHAHHKATGSMERDENYVPYTRSELKLPSESNASTFDYAEMFEETPIFTLGRMLIMQGFGWWLYLTCNTLGSKSCPNASHFDPNSPLFKNRQRINIILSNVCLCFMLLFLSRIGWDSAVAYYLIPYLLTNHWIVMFTYLHHSCPSLPHYRKDVWTFVRGAAATVDRPLLGWMGRFFLHNISHDHVAHHFFPGAPFYNGPEITKCIRTVLKDHYNYDSTPSFYALYRSFTECIFVEDEGGIVFYKNKKGLAARKIETFLPRSRLQLKGA